MILAVVCHHHVLTMEYAFKSHKHPAIVVAVMELDFGDRDANGNVLQKKTLFYLPNSHMNALLFDKSFVIFQMYLHHFYIQSFLSYHLYKLDNV